MVAKYAKGYQMYAQSTKHEIYISYLFVSAHLKILYFYFMLWESINIRLSDTCNILRILEIYFA